MSSEYEDEATFEKELLKEIGALMEKYNDHSKPFPRHLSLVLIYERSDGIVCSPMIPSAFLIQTLYAIENASKHLRDSIHGNTQVVTQVRPMKSYSNMGSAVDDAINELGMNNLGHPPMDSMKGHPDYGNTNERHKALMGQLNKVLGINEPIPELEDCDERMLALETIVKTQMVTNKQWKFLVEDGKVQCVIDFIKMASKDMARIYGYKSEPQFDFSHDEILSMIHGIEQKAEY